MAPKKSASRQPSKASSRYWGFVGIGKEKNVNTTLKWKPATTKPKKAHKKRMGNKKLLPGQQPLRWLSDPAY